MWYHFVNLLSASWHRVLIALGTTTLAILLFSLAVPLATFIITMVVVRSEGVLMERLRKSAVPTLIGLLVPFVGISIVFICSTVRTVYNDHHETSERWRAVVNEKDNLKAELGKRDTYIGKLEQYVATHKYLKTENFCYRNSYDPPPPKTVNAASMSETWVICPNGVKAPYTFSIHYNETPSSYDLPPVRFASSASLPSGMPSVVFDNNGLTLKVQSPSLRPWEGILVVVYGEHPAPPKVENFSFQGSN